LALAVPVVQVIASGRLLKRGILVKSGTALERLANADTVVFDKTGTLTRGRPRLVEAPGGSDREALTEAAALAAASRHPLARALVRAAEAERIAVVPAADVREVPGAGLECTTSEGAVRLGSRAFAAPAEPTGAGSASGPELWLTLPGLAPVRFAFTDELRQDARTVVAGLQARGYAVELLSGDRAPVVAAVAAEVGIQAWRAGCSPSEKVRRLEALAAEGARVLMVGDGLNDAPALAAATVSLSPATAVDVSQTAADLVFQGERLAPVLEALGTARRARALVRENLALAFLYNVTTIPLAIAGLVTPLIAAIAMSTSSIVVILNALRLNRGSAF
jgi:Cu2+-exporting ATPase